MKSKKPNFGITPEKPYLGVILAPRDTMSELKGQISQIVGPVVDVHFDFAPGAPKNLPLIHEAMTTVREDGRTVVIEVQQHIGEDTVRCVAMDSTDGLKRGMEVTVTGTSISMPVGRQIRGRVMDVTGEAIDGLGELGAGVNFRTDILTLEETIAVACMLEENMGAVSFTNYFTLMKIGGEWKILIHAYNQDSDTL